jgi:hypothetical protein
MTTDRKMSSRFKRRWLRKKDYSRKHVSLRTYRLESTRYAERRLEESLSADER